MAKKNYGPWELIRKDLLLTHKKAKYNVHLDDCKTSAAVLDWIFQIHMKEWADSDTIVGLLDALRDTIDPQATLCSSGIEKGPIDPKKIIRISN